MFQMTAYVHHTYTSILYVHSFAITYVDLGHCFVSDLLVDVLSGNATFKPHVHGPRPVLAWFLEMSMNIGVCVCVCPPPRPLIKSHVKGTCNNQIRQFYGFSMSLRHLLSINWMGMLHIMNTCQRRLRLCGTSYGRSTRQ